MYKGPIVVIECDKEPNPKYKQLLHFIDVLVSLFVVAPLVIAFWRGIWNLCDIHLLPDNPLYSALASCMIGSFGYMLFMLPQKFFSDTFDREKHRLTFYLFSRIYTFIFGIISVHGCRGPWNLIDLVTTVDVPTLLLLTALGVTILVIARALTNISAPPFLIANDEKEDYFLITTRFKTSVTEEPLLYILDCLFSTLVLGTVVSVVWRGVWVFFDLVLYPNDPILSGWASMFIGYGIALISFSLQACMRSICDQLEGWKRVTLVDCYTFFAFVGTMSIWRGIWQLLDVYYIPDNSNRSNSTSLILAFILLVLLNCSNSLLARGVVIDAECSSERCVIFPIYYVRSIFEKQRSKKSRYLTDLLGEEYRGKNIIVVLEKNQSDCTGNVIRIDASVLDEGERASECSERTSECSDIKDYSIISYMEDDTSLLDENKNYRIV